MNRFQTREPLERGAASDLWSRTLSQIPTAFGRLVYLCSLRNPNTGCYEHYGLAQAFGDEQADRVLRDSHQQVFSEWLCLRLDQQMADLEAYLAELDGQRQQVIETWLRLAPYRNLVPATVREAERTLYLADLDAILALLQNRYGIGELDPDA